MKLHESGLASGRPLLLLNPFPLHRAVWEDNVRTWLGQGLRIFTADYPGLGPTTGEDGASALHPVHTVHSDRTPALSIDGIADAVVAELDARALTEVVVLGSSMGGYVALSLAARFGARVAGLILVDTRATADSPAARAGRAAALATLQTGTAEPGTGVGTYLGRSLPKLLAPAAPAHLHARVLALAVRRKGGLIAGIAALRDRPDRSAALPALRAPTLVLGGTEDQIVSLAEMQDLARAIPGSRFEPIAGAGHLPNLEQPARFEQLVADFVASLPGGRS